ncbi:MAG: hypothetical protein IMZ71_03855 [Chloroflexi bacterium]|nr:hypothetical protein [Chloroflexota bacterium]
MDFIGMLAEFFAKYVPMFKVMGIVLFVAAVRWVLDAFKIKAVISDGVWRLTVLGLGVVLAFTDVDYEHGFVAVFSELIGKAFAYGGAATLVYQLYRAGYKKLFPDANGIGTSLGQPDEVQPPGPLPPAAEG